MDNDDKCPPDEADLDEAKRIMERLVKSPPKPHKSKNRKSEDGELSSKR